MNTRNHLLATLAAALVLGLTLPGAARADVTEAQIAAARTPADHQAIAQAYEKDAAAAEASAREHEAMVKAYEVAAHSPKGALPASMVTHCNALVKAYRAEAAAFRALAAEHRNLANVK